MTEDLSKKKTHDTIRYFLMKILVFFIFVLIIVYVLNFILKINDNNLNGYWYFSSLIIGISLIVVGISISLFNVKLTILIADINDERIVTLSKKLKTVIDGIDKEKLNEDDLKKIYKDIKNDVDKIIFNGKTMNKISLLLIAVGAIIVFVALMILIGIIPITVEWTNFNDSYIKNLYI